MIDKLEKQIMWLASLDGRGYTIQGRNAHVALQIIENHIEIDRQNKVIDHIGYILEFLIWCRNNLFNESGKISIPILKWLSVIKKVKEFITNISNL